VSGLFLPRDVKLPPTRVKQAQDAAHVRAATRRYINGGTDPVEKLLEGGGLFSKTYRQQIMELPPLKSKPDKSPEGPPRGKKAPVHFFEDPADLDPTSLASVARAHRKTDG